MVRAARPALSAARQRPAGPRSNRFRHAVRRILSPLGGVVEVVGDEAQHEARIRGPGQQPAGDGLAPGFEIGEIRCQRPQRIGAHALGRQMPERGSIGFGQRERGLGASGGQDRGQRVGRRRQRRAESAGGRRSSGVMLPILRDLRSLVQEAGAASGVRSEERVPWEYPWRTAAI